MDEFNIRCEVRCRIPLDVDHIQKVLCCGKGFSQMVSAPEHQTLLDHCYLHLYKNNRNSEDHVAVVFGDFLSSKSLETRRPGETQLDRQIRGADMPRKDIENRVPIVRIHSSCFTSEIVGSVRCDCAEQLRESISVIAAHGCGVIVYLNQEGRGIGLLEKLKAYNLQDMGYDTITANLALGHPADKRSYEISTLILRDLGVSELMLLTNNPDKIKALQSDGLLVTKRIEMMPLKWKTAHATFRISEKISVQSDLDKYLITKIKKMDHLLSIPPSISSESSY